MAWRYGRWHVVSTGRGCNDVSDRRIVTATAWSVTWLWDDQMTLKADAVGEFRYVRGISGS